MGAAGKGRGFYRMAGRDLQEVKELLGHTDIAMTLRYAHLGPTARRDAVATWNMPEPNARSMANR